MIYQTENPEIIELYNIYTELNIFIEYFETSKRNFINYYNIKQSSSYYAFPNDKFGYSNEKKVSKAFREGLYIDEVLKYLELHYKYNNDYIIDFGVLFKRTYKYKTFNAGYIKDVLNDIINFDRLLYNLRKILKQLLKLKLTNKPIPIGGAIIV